MYYFAIFCLTHGLGGNFFRVCTPFIFFLGPPLLESSGGQTYVALGSTSTKTYANGYVEHKLGILRGISSDAPNVTQFSANG